MVKTDEHMLKVKKQLIEQSAKVEEAEIRRKKALQVERKIEDDKRNKDALESISKWRKNPSLQKDREKEEELLSFSSAREKKGGVGRFCKREERKIQRRLSSKICQENCG
eukprot:504367-Hanusia_phi.AAC.1